MTTTKSEKSAQRMDAHAEQIEKGCKLDKIPTAHLTLLHYFNMGQSGAGDHPDVARIGKELAARGASPNPSEEEAWAAARRLGMEI